MASPHTWAALKVVAAAAITRPNDTTAYASGDLVANSTTAASVGAFIFAVAAQMTGQSFFVRKLRLRKSTNVTTSASFRMHFFKENPFASAPAGGDNAALVLAASNIANYLGYIDVTTDKAIFHASDGAAGFGVPTEGSEIAFQMAASASSGFNLYGVLEARSTYTPAANEVFTATIEAYKDR